MPSGHAVVLLGRQVLLAALCLLLLVAAVSSYASVRACEAEEEAPMAPEEVAIAVDGTEIAFDSNGALEGSGDDSAGADSGDSSSTAQPQECSDMAALVASISAGTFVPSAPARWERVKDRVYEATAAAVDSAYGDAGRCDVDRVNASELSPDDFKRRYLEQRPVIIVNATPWPEFAAMTQKNVLLYCFGDYEVTLSTANKNSYHKTESTLRHYVNSMIGPLPLSASGVGTRYFFGDNRHHEWEALFAHYRRPSQYIWSHVSLSFGLGGSGSGVPFHTHGHVFAEVFHGRKRWFLQAPGPGPSFDPDESSLRWNHFRRPELSQDEQDAILDCVCSPGDLLYIPGHWHHGTLNLGETVFMSAFV